MAPKFVQAHSLNFNVFTGEAPATLNLLGVCYMWARDNSGKCCHQTGFPKSVGIMGTQGFSVFNGLDRILECQGPSDNTCNQG